MKNKALSLLASLLVLGVALVASRSANAQVYNLYQGSSFSYNGLTFTVSSCSFQNNSRSSTCNATDYATYLPAGTQFYIATDGASAGSTSVIIEALNGGSQVPIFSYTCGPSGPCTSGAYDLSATLTVTPASGTLSSAVQTLSASGPGDPSADAHATETINPASDPTMSPPLCQLTSNLATSGSLSCTFAPQNSLSVKKDLGITVAGVTNGSTLALNSVVESFAHAPEPSSFAVLVPAIIMLGWASRRQAHS